MTWSENSLPEREAQPVRRAVGADQIDPGDLGLLAAVEREARHGEGLAGRHHRRAVALVEPFRLHAGLALGRLAALEAEAEHLQRIGELLGAGAELGVHLVARRGAAEMGEAGCRSPSNGPGPGGRPAAAAGQRTPPPS